MSGAAVAAGGAPLAADLSVVKQLVNFNDINKLLHETVARERAIDADLDKQLGRRAELEKQILMLNATTSEVDSYSSTICMQ
jgi:hypothetical protein